MSAGAAGRCRVSQPALQGWAPCCAERAKGTQEGRILQNQGALFPHTLVELGVFIERKNSSNYLYFKNKKLKNILKKIFWLPDLPSALRC